MGCMRAAVITEFNAPWQIQTLPDVRPSPGQVVIRVRASGMCGTDVHVHRGLFPVKAPIVAGHEAVGEIVEVGAGVTDRVVGDRVGTLWTQKGCGRCAVCQRGRVDHCADAQTWMNIGGGNSELMLAWASGCALIPDAIPFEVAAPVFCAGHTVVAGLRDASPQPGERIAVLGVGGLGHLAIQYANAFGLEVFAITSQADKTQELRELGAHEVVLSGADPGAALAAAGGADIILSTTSSARQIAAAFNGLRPGGRLVNMGVIDGAIPIDGHALLMGQRQLRGSVPYEAADLAEALAHVASGKVVPRLEVYPLERVNHVRERLEAGKVRYRAVLVHASRGASAR
jgi:alcohol dehydrogenase